MKTIIATLILAAIPMTATTTAYNSTGFAESAQLAAKLLNYQLINKHVDEIGVTPDGDWVIVAGNDVTASAGFPAFALQKINQYIAAGRTIDVVSFAPNGSWIVVAQDLHWRSAGLPEPNLLADKIEERLGAGKRIQEIAFSANGNGWAILSGNWAYMHDVTQRVYDAVHDRVFSKRDIQGIHVFGTRWALYADQWIATNNLPTAAVNSLKSWQAQRKAISHVRLNANGGYILYSNGAYTPDASKTIELAEDDIKNGKNIYQRMAELGVPGVSIAVVEDNEVKYARSYGVLQAGTQNFAIADSPFDLASLSKYLGALTAMRVVDEGLMTLATDARAIANQGGNTNQLALWKQWGEAAPALFGITPGVTLPSGMTLRRLLSHTASLVPHSSTGFAVSAFPNAPPQTWQLLLGNQCTSGGCSYGGGRQVWYNPDFGVPGTIYDYSGGGFLVAEAMVAHVTGQGFCQVAQQRVFGPLGMTDTQCVTAPPGATLEAKLAKHHDDNGVPRPERVVYPWAAAGGFYASAKDYAKAIIPLLNSGAKKDGTQFLHPFTTALMMTDHAAGSKKYGLGISLSETSVNEVSGFFAHDGSHGNRAHTYMSGHPQRNQAFVVLVNAGGGNVDFATEVTMALRNAYGW